MKMRLLGQSGLKVSELCLGTMTFGTETAIGSEEDECRRVFDTYLEAGGNFIDTANIYTFGTSERMLGRFIAGRRSSLVIATKYAMNLDLKNPNSGGNSRKALREAVEGSLSRLGTDYIDLLWVHAWDALTPLEETLRGLDDLVRAGKVLYTGFSNAPAWIVARAQTLAESHDRSPMMALQLHYSLIERNVERELLPCAAALGMTVTAWSPLAGGLLSGKYAVDPAARTGQEGRLTSTGWGNLFLRERNLAIAETVRTQAARLGQSSSSIAIRWLMERGVIPILGARHDAQLRDLLTATQFSLDAEATAALETASQIDLGYPRTLLEGPMGQRMLHGDRVGEIIRR
jgi:aryl-alcohol dehydrogenase-like predicted oxidoreductase